MADAPIEIVEAAVLGAEQEHRKTNGVQYWGYREYAHAATVALGDERIISHALAAIREHPWTAPDVEDLTDRELRILLRVAFGSLKEN